VQDWERLYEDTLFPKAEREPQPMEYLLADKSPVHYQYKGRYIMTAVHSGLMVIDQHRADMRIRYEHYLELLTQRQSSTQKLLFPEVVQFAPSEIALFDHILPELAAVGFDLSDLGGGNVAVAGVPSGLDGLNPVSLVRGLVSDAAELSGTAAIEQLRETLALSLARQAAIPWGQVLTNDEMERVVNQLFACSNVNYTPDGRSILAILPQHDIEQLLG
jgi:DNA mismatch repair protein MutL